MKKPLQDRIKIDDTLFEFQSPTFSNLSEIKLVIDSLLDYKKSYSGASYGLWNQSNLIGLLTINRIDWDDQIADLGIWLIENSTNKGIAYKAFQSLVDMCWNTLDMKSLTAHTAVSNIKCQRLLEKLSFNKIKILKNHIKVRNNDVDEYRYQLVRPL
jgi:RimJ/RimL family protein N-acetyltransferase